MTKLNYIGYKFGDFFKEIVRERGYSQVGLSKATKLSIVTLSRYANNLIIPSESHFKLIIETLAKSIPQESQKKYIEENTATYESIKQAFNDSKKGLRRWKNLKDT